MKGLPESMGALIKEFSRLPGIGPKSAQRLAFFILARPAEDARRLSAAVTKLKESVKR